MCRPDRLYAWRSGFLHAVIALVVVELIGSGSAFAEVSLDDCVGVSAPQVRRILAAELDGPLVDERVVVRCSPEAVVIDVEPSGDDAGGSSRHRHLDLQAEPAMTRARVLALAIVEMLAARRNEIMPRQSSERDRQHEGQSRRLAVALVHLAALTVAADGAAQQPGQPLPDGRILQAPTDGDRRGLQLLEEEFQRYRTQTQRYISTVDSLARRDQHRRRTKVVTAYEQRRADEEALLLQIRRRAIEEFEAFLERHPHDPIYTPDAMFRLAELYYEADYDRYLDALDRSLALQERHDRGEDVELSADPVKDFSRTISLFRRLVSTYPDYRHIDGAFYLLGFCLNETGLFEEARVAWLAMVCSNQFQYEGPITHAETTDGEEHPAAFVPLRMASLAEDEPFTNPYASCIPVVDASRFHDETWLRIGEYHFDYDSSSQGLELAIVAYRNAMSDPESPFYDEALYKLAWSHYRASHYPEAIRHFAMLVEYADTTQERTGRSGSEMRPEAIQYLGVALSEDDWDHDDRPDRIGTIDRLQDEQLLPQDRPYTSEVYFQTGDTLFEIGRYDQAIAVYEIALQRWPTALAAPRGCQRIVESYERQNDIDGAREASRCFLDYGAGSPFEVAHREAHPEAVQRATLRARGALRDTARSHHETAQRLRHRAPIEDEQRTSTVSRQALAAYARAVELYQRYLELFPNDPEAYELSYDMAEALYFSDRHEEAAEAYSRVRDSNIDDRLREDAAFRCVKALEEVRDQEIAAGRLSLPSAPPQPVGSPPRVTSAPIPAIVSNLNRARDEYSRLFPGSARARLFQHHAALVLYRLGHWDEGRRRFEDLYVEACNASPVAFLAWESLVAMATDLGDLDAAEQLGVTQRARQCAESDVATLHDGETRHDGEAATDVESSPASSSAAVRLIKSIWIRRAQDRFNEARRTKRPELYEQSAQMFLEAVEGTPDHPEAASALNNAALAYESVDRYESAMGVWRRIVEDHGESEFVDVARFRLAYNAYRFFEYDEAVNHFQLLARNSKNQDIRRDSLLNTATILTNLEQYDKAAPYWRQYSEPGVAPDSKSRSEAAFRAAEMSYKRRDWNDTIREMRAFNTAFRTVPQAGPYRVRAAYLIADAYKKQRNDREYFRALENVTSEFQTSGEKSGSVSAEYAAEARFRLVDRDIDSLENIKIGGRSKQITEQVEGGARRVSELENSYKRVTAYRRPEWTVASHMRIGYAYELLAKAMLDSDVPTDSEQILIQGLPADVRRELKRIPVAQRHEMLQEQIDAIEQQWRDDMIKRVSGMEDRAVAEYELCVRAAREGNIVNDYTRQAHERLFAYRPEQYPLQREGRTALQLDSVATSRTDR